MVPQPRALWRIANRQVDGRSYYGTEREDQHAGAIIRTSCLSTLCFVHHVPRNPTFPARKTAWGIGPKVGDIGTTNSLRKAVYMSIFKTILVIGLCLVSILTANPIHRVEELDFVPAKVLQVLHGPRSQHRASNTNGKLCNSSDRLCKLHRRTQDFYIWRARPHELLFPVHYAAPALREFYNAILTQVNEQWSLLAPVPSFGIKQGNLELYFRSVGGPIPWSVVARFAHKMLCATQLGWLGTYEIIYQNGAANQAVVVTLRIANNQLQLPQHDLTKSRTVKAAKRTDLKKRASIRLISFKVHDGIVPLSVAAPCAKAFFDAIVAEASNAWTSQSEAALFTVTQGPFQLTVYVHFGVILPNFAPDPESQGMTREQ